MSGSGPGAALEEAFVLHARPYQETSRILEVLSATHGRVGLVARGARRPKSPWRSVLQPFLPVRLSWVGRGPLHTLRSAESASFVPPLGGLGLMAAFYLNELVMSFVRRGDPHPGLFVAYSHALAGLRAGGDPEPTLRRFELQLLAEAGYGLNLDHDVLNDVPVDPARHYEYRLEHGPVLADAPGAALTLSGTELLAISRGDLGSPDILLAAKRLLRAVVAHHLEGRTLKTRQVLAAMLR
ncbi:MAG: DNA repair protein RecO [Gammaproteobacteria bacterium PRO9]|nr:DNA repair protein RecO [Gammaproteobacteria bacterium PRO9]